MTPTHFTISKDRVYYHYKTSEIREFMRLGLRDGNVGMLLIKRQGTMLTYKGFGTIENPFNYIMSLTINHFEPFDGKMPTDAQRCIPPTYNPNNCKAVFLNFTPK